ncbi:uncharacterized protein LOC124344317 [Daphnia pulicaria]|uniref:uncharacterized protein LOC124344317 n=1 Tax=Daphnia pulicaria TaxID=35523 RepID=UPI001EECB920|nr:uncharacterized protein LOC124344317 [Daphnia pulicaria]
METKNVPSKESSPPPDYSNYSANGERRLSLADYLLILKHVGRNEQKDIDRAGRRRISLAETIPDWPTLAKPDLIESAEKAPTPRRPSLAEIIPDWPILQPFNREEVPLKITSIIFFFLDF